MTSSVCMLVTHGPVSKTKSMPFHTASERTLGTKIFAMSPTELETKYTARNTLTQSIIRHFGLPDVLKNHVKMLTNGSSDDIECTVADS